MNKPLGHKAYGSIPHLPGSRQDRSDKGLGESQARLCFTKCDCNTRIIIQEKLDGCCMSVWRDPVTGDLVPLGRSGYLAASSKFEHMRMFAIWVNKHTKRFSFLGKGERVVGEWLALAHGIKYKPMKVPFVPFDIMTNHDRLTFGEFLHRLPAWFPIPVTLPTRCPMSIADAYTNVCWFRGIYGSERPEGLVYRVERGDKVLFLGKAVRTDKVDGCYLPETTGLAPV